jgi:hypothetical protein
MCLASFYNEAFRQKDKAGWKVYILAAPKIVGQLIKLQRAVYVDIDT